MKTSKYYHVNRRWAPRHITRKENYVARPGVVCRQPAWLAGWADRLAGKLSCLASLVALAGLVTLAGIAGLAGLASWRKARDGRPTPGLGGTKKQINNKQESHIKDIYPGAMYGCSEQKINKVEKTNPNKQQNK